MAKMTFKEAIIKKELFLEEYFKNKTLSKSIEATGIKATVYFNWMKHDDEFNIAKKQVDELIASVVEERLWVMIDKCQFPAVKFFLENKHKDYMAEKEENLSVKASYPVIRFVEAKESYQQIKANKEKKKK